MIANPSFQRPEHASLSRRAKRLSRNFVGIGACLTLVAFAHATLIPLNASYDIWYQGLQFGATGVGVIDTTGGTTNWVVVTHPLIASPDPMSFAFSMVHEVLGNGMRPRSPGDWNLWDFHGGHYQAIQTNPWGGFSELALIDDVLVQRAGLQGPLSADWNSLSYREVIRRGPPDPDEPLTGEWSGSGMAGPSVFETNGYYIGNPPHAFSGEMEVEHFSTSRHSPTEFRIEWRGWMVPEPSSAILFGVGLGLVAVSCNRRFVCDPEDAGRSRASPADSSVF